VERRGDLVEGQGPLGVGDPAVQVHVARAVGHQSLVEDRHRLDVDTVPAPLVEQLRDRVEDRVVRPHVDVEAGVPFAEHPGQQDILAVLGVRDAHLRDVFERDPTRGDVVLHESLDEPEGGDPAFSRRHGS
jgi:hypothetical protein